MADLMPAIAELEIAQIAVGQRLRPVDQAGVDALLIVIRDHGFTVPVVVRRKKTGFVLIDGAHRLQAMSQLGASSIPVRAYTCTDTEARAMEAAQNLAGVSLTPLDDAIFLAAYQASYLELHPETARGMAGALAKHGFATDLKSFADVIADKRAMSVRHVQKLAAAGRKITREEADQLRLSPVKVTLDSVLAIGKLPDGDERTSVIRKLSLGAAKSVGAARAAYRTEIGATTPPMLGEKDAKLQALITAWGRAGAKMQRAFVETYRDDLERLLAAAEGEE